MPAWAWPLLALPIVAVTEAWTYRSIARAERLRIESSLQSMLASQTSALGHWLDSEASLAEVMASDPRVVQDVKDLIAIVRRTGGDPAMLKAAPAQKHLRALLAPVVSQQENAGFLVLDASGVIVARVVDDRVGDRVVLGVADAASQALAGKRTFLAPTMKQRFATGPMAFMLVPMREESGGVSAVFGFRIRPEQMAAILNGARVGETGETYAVDADGRMITDSRFTEDAAKLGLLPAEAGGRTVAALDVRDPGAPLAEGVAPATPPKTWPPTWAAAEVVTGRAGVNAAGYRNYLGVPAVGAWRSMPEWGIGVVTEIHRDEAYQTLSVVRRGFEVLAGALLLVAAAIAFSSRRIYGLQREIRKAERLGQYTLEDKIGEGGMGAVYRARHAFLRRPTAVKLIRPERASAEAVARFEREVQLTSQLTHPNTIAIYDYGHTPDGIFYYAMEYLPGLPLDRVILDDGPQPEPRVVHLITQICASLAEAHRIGLVHRDVKPANVILCERGGTYDVVKVLDFGLVKELRPEADAGVTAADHVVGTPLYMAPEAVIASANVSPRSDVYAVGAVAYALVTGKHVFTGNSGVEIVGHHLHTAPVAPSERLGRPVDAFLEKLILSCLSKSPEDRPADAGAVLQHLEEGWPGPTWRQADARAWWETRAPAMLAARVAAEESVSRGPKLDVDVGSRVRSESLPELSLGEGTATAIRPAPKPPVERS